MMEFNKLVTMSTSTLTGCPKEKKPAAAEGSDSRDSDSILAESGSPNLGENNSKPGVLRLCVKMKKPEESNSSDGHLSDQDLEKVDLGVPESKLFLPFLVGAPKLTECRACEYVIDPGEEVFCSIRDCNVSYHESCARDCLLSAELKCPQHACFLCNSKYNLWQCSRCDLASHDKCAAYPEYIVRLDKKPRHVICWRHSTESPPLKPADPTNSIQEVFCRLPLHYVEEEFSIDIDNMWKDIMADNLEPPPYVHIRRNIYLVKKKCDDVDDNIGCAASCDWEICSNDCLCRRLRISCSSDCGCSDICTNRPFKKEKKVKIVMTSRCGWGLEAAEFIEKGDFIIEYVGEVISDGFREERFWDLKNKGVTNFYMCEVRKDFTIDATFKGNASRFMNHSCDPNCNLEKWVVNGETRLGVFAARSIELGEPLTYDYQFVQYGQEVDCHCGASNCQGSLGTKKKLPKLQLVDWGAKGRRSVANPRNRRQCFTPNKNLLG